MCFHLYDCSGSIPLKKSVRERGDSLQVIVAKLEKWLRACFVGKLWAARDWSPAASVC
jgi:hypothetical protein